MAVGYRFHGDLDSLPRTTMRKFGQNPRWSPLQRKIYTALSGPLLLFTLLALVAGLVLLWIGLHEGGFLAEP